MVRMLTAAAFTIALALPQAGFAADAANGKSLHDDRGCTASCHGEEVYTRDNRRNNTLPQLTAQVEMCNNNVPGETWFDDEIVDVVHHLNLKFYHLKK